MYTEHKLWELAEAAVEGRLSADEAAALDAYLSQDPAAAAAHQERIHMLHALHEEGSRKRFRETLSRVHAGMPAERKPVHLQIGALLRRHSRSLAMAASVALVTSLITVAAMQQGSKRHNPTVQNYQLLRREIDRIKQSQNIQQRQIQAIALDHSTDKGAFRPQPGNFSGTGFALSNDGYLLTNYHVAEGADSIYIQLQNGTYHKARMVASEPKADIAVLKIESAGFRFSKSGDVPYTFSASRASLGSRIFTLGYPQDEVVYNEGYISSAHGFNGDTIQYRLEVPAGPGQSGAPVLDANGVVIGMISGKDQRRDGTTYALTSQAILRLINDLPRDARVALPRTNRLSGAARTDQIQKMQQFTCVVQVYKAG